MKTHFLFPKKFNLIGWIIFTPALIVSLAVPIANIDIDNMLTTEVFAIAVDGLFEPTSFFRFNENSIGDEVLLSLLILGGLLIGFSKQNHEDEYIAKIRYESLVWSTYFNFSVMLLATWFVYGSLYFQVMIANIFSLLLFFIIRFQIKLYQLKKGMHDDE